MTVKSEDFESTASAIPPLRHKNLNKTNLNRDVKPHSRPIIIISLDTDPPFALYSPPLNFQPS